MSIDLRDATITPYTVGIIGLGHIASTYATPGDPEGYSHSSDTATSTRVLIAAVAHICEGARRNYSDAWQNIHADVAAYSDFQALWPETPCDIIAVCVRGPDHFAVMQDVIVACPWHIFLEEPPACSLQESDALVAAAQAAGIGVTVSYSRHWDPVNLHMQQLELAQTIGTGNVGLLLDSWHLHTSGDDVSVLTGLSPNDVVNVHISDAPAGFSMDEYIDCERCLPLETGIIDLQAFMRKLDEIGYDGPITAEPFNARLNALAAEAPDAALRETAEVMDRAWALR